MGRVSHGWSLRGRSVGSIDLGRRLDIQGRSSGIESRSSGGSRGAYLFNRFECLNFPGRSQLAQARQWDPRNCP